MSDRPIDLVLSKLPDAKPNASGGYLARCPVHHDRNPSLSISEAADGRALVHCFAGCTSEHVVKDLGLKMRDLYPARKSNGSDGPTSMRVKADGCTLEQYAEAKQLSITFLRDLGLRDTRYRGCCAVEIPYRDRDGRECARRYRVAVDGDDKFRWRRGDKPCLYGLWRLQEDEESIVLVEGESDAQTLWLHGLPTLGLPGASSWSEARDAPELDHYKDIFVVIEADQGGEAVLRWIATSKIRDRVRLVRLPKKDANALFIDNPSRFVDRFIEALEIATPCVERTADLNADSDEPPTIKLEGDTNAEEMPDTDMANASRLVRLHGDRLRYTPERGWLIWDGGTWAVDDQGRVMGFAKDTARAVFDELKDAPDSEAEKRLFTWARRSQFVDRLKAMLTVAQTEPGIPARWVEFDADRWLLNCRNGILDLRTGTLRPHSPAALLSRLVGIDYDPDAGCPLWGCFLEQVVPDQETRAYLQRSVGYSLTGDTSEQCLFFLFGVGANGKTVFLETLFTLFHQYATATRVESFLVRRNDAIPNDLARLANARFVTVSETPEGRRFSEGLIKDVTGGDTITARFLHREFFDFRPRFKLWIRGNHKPQIRGTDEGIWRRLHLVPFSVTIPEDERDPHLPERLKTELSGILRWAVEGCLAWQREGLKPPARVRNATAEYRASMDEFGHFIEDRCCVSPEATVGASALYAEYKGWCEETGHAPLTQTAVGLALSERGFTKKRRRKGAEYQGVGLLR